MLPLMLSYTVIFMLVALLFLPTACLPCPRFLAAKDFIFPLAPVLSTSLMQELTSVLSLSFLPLVNSGTPYLLLYFYFLPLGLLQEGGIMTLVPQFWLASFSAPQWTLKGFFSSPWPDCYAHKKMLNNLPYSLSTYKQTNDDRDRNQKSHFLSSNLSIHGDRKQSEHNACARHGGAVHLRHNDTHIRWVLYFICFTLVP